MKSCACLCLLAAVVIALGQPACLTADEPVVDKVTWQRNLYAGWKQAGKEKRPLVVLFTLPAEDDCSWCQKLDQEVLDTLEFHQFAGRAVFVRAVSTDEDDKGNYAQLKSDLDIKRYPTIVVLDATEERIIESGRVIGFFESDEYVKHLHTLLQAWTDGQVAATPE